MFALDRTNYARWLRVHIKNMLALQSKHPEIYRELQSGKFTVQKTANAFSGIPLGQVYEQNNELIKGDSGAIGLTENPSALKRWRVAGREFVRLVREFEKGLRIVMKTSMRSCPITNSLIQVKQGSRIMSALWCQQ